MISWDLLLCGQAMFDLARDIDNLEKNKLAYTPVRDLIQRHRLTISDELVDAYDRFFDNYSIDGLTNDTCKAIGEGYLVGLYDEKAFSNYTWVDFETSCEQTIEETIKSLYRKLEEQGYRPLIVQAEQDGESEINSVCYMDWLSKDIHNLLTRNTIEFHYYAQKNESASNYQKWFYELFTGEKTFYIFDSFFLKWNAINSFIKYYLSSMERDSTVNIFCSTSIRNGSGPAMPIDSSRIERMINRLSSQATMNGINLRMIDAIIEAEHDRFIYSEKFKLYIGVGLDYLKANNDLVRRNSQLSLTYYDINEFNRILGNYRNVPFFETRNC